MPAMFWNVLQHLCLHTNKNVWCLPCPFPPLFSISGTPELKWSGDLRWGVFCCNFIADCVFFFPERTYQMCEVWLYQTTQRKAFILYWFSFFLKFMPIRSQTHGPTERWADQKAQYQKVSLLLWTRICLESLILQVKISDLSDVSQLGKSLFTCALVYLQNMTFFMTWTRDVWWTLPLKSLKLNPLCVIDSALSILYWIYDLSGFSNNLHTL